ncbi:MAG: hypothetical protein K2J15_06385 [Muribaculaceae bacterium]|nr:hypothetical protein [Muribaculaceae bacterium]
MERDRLPLFEDAEYAVAGCVRMHCARSRTRPRTVLRPTGEQEPRHSAVLARSLMKNCMVMRPGIEQSGVPVDNETALQWLVAATDCVERGV